MTGEFGAGIPEWETLGSARRLERIATDLRKPQPDGTQAWEAMSFEAIQQREEAFVAETQAYFGKDDLKDALERLSEGETPDDVDNRNFFEPNFLRFVKRHLDFAGQKPPQQLFTPEELEVLHGYFEVRRGKTGVIATRLYETLSEDFEEVVEAIRSPQGQPGINPEFSTFASGLPETDMGEPSADAQKFLAAFVEYISLLPESEQKPTLRKWVTQFRVWSYVGATLPLDLFRNMATRPDGTIVGVPNDVVRNLTAEDIRKALQVTGGSNRQPEGRRGGK